MQPFLSHVWAFSPLPQGLSRFCKAVWCFRGNEASSENSSCTPYPRAPPPLWLLLVEIKVAVLGRAELKDLFIPEFKQMHCWLKHCNYFPFARSYHPVRVSLHRAPATPGSLPLPLSPPPAQPGVKLPGPGVVDASVPSPPSSPAQAGTRAGGVRSRRAVPFCCQSPSPAPRSPPHAPTLPPPVLTQCHPPPHNSKGCCCPERKD